MNLNEWISFIWSSPSLLCPSVECQTLVVCSSCLDNETKAALSNVLPPLGGKLVNSWTQDCTHLAMPSVKVTIKVRNGLCVIISRRVCVYPWSVDKLPVFLIRPFLRCCAVDPSWNPSSSQSSTKPFSKNYPLLKLRGRMQPIHIHKHNEAELNIRYHTEPKHSLIFTVRCF